MNDASPHPIALPGSPGKKQESRDAQKVLRLLAKKLAPLGFRRTKSTFFTRPTKLGLEFVHVHKFSFAASFRVHFGLRVRTDEFPAAHLNGPTSDEIRNHEDPRRRRYEFDYGPGEETWQSCAQALCECVCAEGLDWFASMNNAEVLLGSGSPLTQSARTALRWELENPSKVEASEATQRALNAA
jgi:hypothetical protein